MKLKFIETLIESTNDLENAIYALTFTPNSKKLAIALKDRHILLFDDNLKKRDKFSTKPIDSKFGKKNYIIKCLIFSPDSKKLAVGQTDNIIYVYRLGENWDEKKVICNKFLQNSAVSSILWPEETRLIIGLVDGKVRSGSTNSNKCSTLYKTDSMVVALSQHPNRRFFVSGHANGSIIVYSFENKSQVKICVHLTAPYCLIFSNFGILAAGADRRIISYNSDNGKMLQDFDYNISTNINILNDLNNEIDNNEKEFYVAVADSSVHNIVFGSYNRIRLMSWNQKRGAWDESTILNFYNLHTITALAWKPDGTTIIAANSTGAVISIDCCMKRSLLKNRFEITYISPSQVAITDTKSKNDNQSLLNTNGNSLKCIIRSIKNFPITNIQILNSQNSEKIYVLGHTLYTLILADIQNNLYSEIEWNWSGNEKFYLENENVCLILNAGEIKFVEYGNNLCLGSIRTERINPHLISVRVNNIYGNNINNNGNLSARSDLSGRAIKRRMLASHALQNHNNFDGKICRVAYLLDVHTILIVNLLNDAQIAQISHTNSIDWIELNESANKLLFRDVCSSLFLYDVNSKQTRNLLNYSSYVQWVPQSDVIVAQSGDNLCIWYNYDESESINNLNSNTVLSKQNAIRFPIQGDVEMVLRDENHTEVIVLENDSRVAYELDSAMIEFGTALNNLDLNRAIIFLERCEQEQNNQKINNNNKFNNYLIDESSNSVIMYDLKPMWQRLATVALQNFELLIAQRCFAALNDLPKVSFLQQTLENAELSLYLNYAKKDQELNGILIENEPLSAAVIASHYSVRARIAMLNKDFKTAERIYLENHCIEEAIQMYKKLNHWESAIELAKAMNYYGLENLKKEYYTHLNESGQQEKIAEIKVSEGDINGGLNIYLELNRPILAVRLILENAIHLLNNELIVENILNELKKNKFFDKAGELLEELKRYDDAIQAFCEAKNYGKAIRIAKLSRPENVVQLEEEWANELFNNQNFNNAINHFLESGNIIKATESAIRAKEWNKAIEILNILNNDEINESNTKISQFYVEIARYYEAEGQFDKAEKFYLDGNQPMEAIEMYNKAARWVDAFKLTNEFFGIDETRDLYAQKAESLERSGRLKEAEDLYISIGNLNQAILMYKNANHYDEMMRLIQRYYPENVSEMHKRLASEMEKKGDLKGAEEHYLSANDWNSVIEMYKEAEQWSDAFRIAKNANEDRAYKQVAYLWAKSLGGDAAVKLLTKHGLLNEVIDMGLSKNDFNFVFELCNFGAKIRLNDAYQKYAQYLENEGDIQQAEKFYLKAEKAREAILMHIHYHNWDSAEQIANLHLSEMLNEIFIARALFALEEQNFSEAEIYLLRANRADIILSYYRKINAWTDALRIASKYFPDLLEQVQNEYDEAQLKLGAKGVQSFIAQASEWERQGEYKYAVDCYSKIDKTNSDDTQLIKHSQCKAGELIIKFLRNNESQYGLNSTILTEKIETICGKLIEIQQFNAAADLFLMAEMPKQAVEVLIEANEWIKVQRIAAEISPEIEMYVDEKYKEFLRLKGRVTDLIDIDVVSAIDILIEQRQWKTALTTAKQQNHRTFLDKYLIIYVTELIKEENFLSAVKIFLEYGTSTNPQNFNIYRTLIDCLLNNQNNNYEVFASLRDMIFDLNNKLRIESSNNTDEKIIQIFERYQFILHLYALNKALETFLTNINLNNIKLEINLNEIKKLRLKQFISMLRYIDFLQPDKVFYEAGNECKEFGNEYENLGFLLLNHCLDIFDAIEENDPSLVDNIIFENTDVPQHYAIPQTSFLNSNQFEEIKEWVLTASLSQSLIKELKTDSRNCFEASSIDLFGQTYPLCIISGYPILNDNKIMLGNNNTADPENWTLFNTILQTQLSDEIFDVKEYLTKLTN